ncbi:MAG: response regulator [Elusimicrobia bacterium]|nr:response regulator [Elusimicrobiota bacterium]
MTQELADPKNKLILVVDDDGPTRDLLEMTVKNEGFRVDTAASGTEALKKADAQAPDLIILDFMLPGSGGYEVAKELQMGDARSVPIIIVTGRRLDRNTTTMLRAEPNIKEYVEKPVKTPVLATMIHRILGTQPPTVNRKQDRGPLSSSW